VKGEVYGTLNFSSPAPKARAFTEIDIEALRLMAAKRPFEARQIIWQSA
jgi:hypothetical protein